MKLIPYPPPNELATRTDMHAQTATIRGELAELRGELRGEMAELRGELRGEMAGLRADLKTGSSIALASFARRQLGWWPRRWRATPLPSLLPC